MAQETIEISLAQKRFNITLDPLLDEAKTEVKALFANEVDVDIITLLKAYITKTQEYARICQSLETLYTTIEKSQEVGTKDQECIKIQSVENLHS